MMMAGSQGLDSSEDEGIVMKRKSVRHKFVESDDEDRGTDVLATKEFLDSDLADDAKKGELGTHKKKKWKILLDSNYSSDDETRSSAVEQVTLPKKNDLHVSENSEEGEHRSWSRFALTKNSDLYDAEDSDDEITPMRSLEHGELYDAEGSEDEVAPKHNSKGSSKSKRRSTSERKSKTNAVQQIHSETQRIVRQSRVSLPYHRPRQRSLAEFLQRRHTSAPSLKMSAENLGQVWKQLEAREKEAETFYKSDSEESTDCNIAANNDTQCDLGSTELNTESRNDNAVSSDICNDTNTCLSDSNITASCEKNHIDNDASIRDVYKIQASDNGIVCNNNDENTTPNSNNSTAVVGANICDTDNNVTSVGDMENADHGAKIKQILNNNNSTAVVGADTCDADNNVTSVGGMENADHGAKIKQILNNNNSTAVVGADTCDADNNVISVGDMENADHGAKTKQGLKGEDSCDFHLHYSESQSVDIKGPDVVTSSVLYEDESNAMDLRLEDMEKQKEDSNTENLVLHYTETQDMLPKESGGDKMESCVEKVPWWENLQPPSPDSDSGDKTQLVLQRLARRSLPGIGDITKMKPRLSGAPNELIQLDEEEPGSAGVIKLVERFMKHSTTKRPVEKKHTMDIGVVSAEKNEDGVHVVNKDVVTVVLGGEESEEDPAMAKPGAKLQRLKEELQQQIAKRRAQEWDRRLQEYKLNEEVLFEKLNRSVRESETRYMDDPEDARNVLKTKASSSSISPSDMEELSDCGDGLDEADVLEAETTETETETEEEEEDVPLVDKKRVKSAFLDDEAEVSDDEESGDEEDEANTKTLLKEDASDLSDGENENEVDQDIATVGMKGITNDNSSAEVEINTTEEDDMDEDEARVDKCDLETNMLKDVEENAGIEELLLYSPKRATLERAKTFDLFISQDEGDSYMELIPPYQAPRSQATLIGDAEEDHNRRIMELDSLTSTPSTQSTSPSITQTCDNTPTSTSRKLFTEPEPLNTQDNMNELLALCSGGFPDGIDRLVDPAVEVSRTNVEDELLGLCSGKFASQPVNLHSLESKARMFRSLLVYSDNDEEEEEVMNSKLRRKHKKLDFSDESDVESDATCELPDETEPTFLDYDSEENEVAVSAKQEHRSRRAAEFFENEAELSESDWDSADEDERGLDSMELEEGDTEKLDQRKVKEQLDRIHMRRLLDDDRREVRLLQEILLEDGELHSENGGRERKFRWKNINNVDDSELPRQDTDNEGADDVDNEDEELWRRMRHEREMFLEQQKKKAPTESEDVLCEGMDSQLLRLGRAALKRINSQDQTEQPPPLRPTVSDPLMSPDAKHPFKLLTKRGSFLARGENALARIAELTRGTTGGPVTGAKNSRNFVFATLSPEKAAEKSSVETVNVKVKKRKQEPGVTPPIVKRLRMSDEHSRGRRLLDLLT